MTRVARANKTRSILIIAANKPLYNIKPSTQDNAIKEIGYRHYDITKRVHNMADIKT